MNTALIKNLAKMLEQATPEEMIAACEVNEFVEAARAICEVKYGVCSQDDFPMIWKSLTNRLSSSTEEEVKELLEYFGFHVDGGEVVNGEAIPMKAWLKKCQHEAKEDNQ